ncbi:MAG: lipopolysaccharide biosynthesis protein [Cyanobacteria bacterium RM1_2_2]|nr:lipopolysaccharide biosynthesis protein [Cyanobacteria bacterium RM1_2_2]
MLIEKIRQILSNRFIKNASWLGAAELVNRVLRLGTTVVIARMLTPYDYGLVAVVLTTNEFSNVFTLRSGIGSKLIQAKEEDLAVLADTAYWMNWILCVAMFFLQCIAAFPIGWYYGSEQVILPICVVALTYLMLPTFAVQGSLIYRENRLKIPALCNALQALVANVLTIVLALLGFGIWAIVLPIVVSLPVWIVVNRINHPWRSRKPFSLYRWREIAGFSLNVLGVDLLGRIRANLDYLLVGRIIGIDALGIYYFAFNAGLGISLNLIQALTWSLFPHLCDSRGDLAKLKERYFTSLKVVASIIIPWVLLQSSLAPFYVPIVFGQKWITAIPILIVICLSAIPRPFSDAASMLLQSVDKSRIDLYWNVIFTAVFTISLLFAIQWGIFWVAIAVLVSHVLAMPLFTVWATRYVFQSKSLTPSK